MSLLTKQLKKDFDEDWVLEKDGKFYKLIKDAVAPFNEGNTRLHVLGDEMENPVPEVAVPERKEADSPDGCIAMLCGGLNGPGDWESYLANLRNAFSRLKLVFDRVWLIRLDNDCVDDIFYLTIGCSEPKE